jgi:hypothetical protein
MLFLSTVKALGKIAISTLIGGAIVGYIGFACGFFGPIIFAPQSNQGPLLGIFVTDPLGMVVGAILGALYGLVQYQRQKRNTPPLIQG